MSALAPPIAGVGLPPLPHSFDIDRTTEVIAVFGFAQPLALASGFAGFAAWGRRTVALVPDITMVGSKEDVTVLTLALADVTYHWPESPQVNDRPVPTGKKVGKKTKREEVDGYPSF
jgi:hypothetical protein